MAKFTDEDNAFVPSSYEELYEYYVRGRGGDSLTKTLIRFFVPLASEDDKEALSHDVFVRCMERDVIRIYDPSKANFGGVIFFVTRSVCLNFKDRRTRSPLDGKYGGSIQLGQDHEFEPGVFRLDTIFSVDSGVNERTLTAKNMTQKLLSWAQSRAAHPQNKRDQSLLPLLVLLLEDLDPKECAPRLGVTAPTVINWIGYIRSQLPVILGA